MPDLVQELPAISWFIAVASLAAMAWAVGVSVGRSSAPVSRTGLLLGVAGLLAWGYLMRHQEVAVQLIPASVLSRVEGVAAVPLFMLVVGIAWTRAHLSRQRHIIGWAMVVGAIYFVQGGWWMLQTTPAMGQRQATVSGIVLQSQDYSCVAAASATALNMLGIATSEAEMAELTETRPGTGATTLRAMAALERKLVGTGYRVDLVSPDYPRLCLIDLPALTPLQFDATRRHMVTLLSVSPEGVTYADPMEGMAYMDRKSFMKVYRGQVLVLRAAGE